MTPSSASSTCWLRLSSSSSNPLETTKSHIEKRYIIHVAGFNLGVLLRALFGLGTPKGLADAPAWLIFARIGELGLLILVIWVPNATEQPDYPIIVCIGWQI